MKIVEHGEAGYTLSFYPQMYTWGLDVPSEAQLACQAVASYVESTLEEAGPDRQAEVSETLRQDGIIDMRAQLESRADEHVTVRLSERQVRLLGQMIDRSVKTDLQYHGVNVKGYLAERAAASMAAHIDEFLG